MKEKFNIKIDNQSMTIWKDPDPNFKKISRISFITKLKQLWSGGNGMKLTEQFLRELKFIKCGKYYRTKLYDNIYLEIDTEDWFTSIVHAEKLPIWKHTRITKIALPSKMTKENLIKLLEIMK